MADDLIVPQIRNGGTGPAPTAGRVTAPDYRSVKQTEELPVRQINMAANEMADAHGAVARELAHVFREGSSAVSAYLDPIMKKAGEAAGTQAGMDPNFKPMTGLAAVSAYGNAYDAAAHVSYVNSTKSQIETQLTKAEQDSEGDPIAFQKQATAITDAIVKQAPLLYRPEIQNEMALRTAAGVARTREQAIRTAQSDAFASYTDSVDSRIDSALQTASTLPDSAQSALVQSTVAGNQTQIDALVKARAVTPERGALLQKKFVEQMTKAVHGQFTANVVDHFMDFARGGDVDAADKALHNYIADPKNSDADKTEVTKKYLAEADNFHQAQSRIYANQVAAVGVSLVGNEAHPGAFGRGVENKIHGLYKIGAISPEGLHTMLDQSMRNQLQGIKDDTTNQLVDAAVHGGTKLDPENAEVRKAADKYFTTHMSTSNVAPLSDLWTASVSSFAKLTNIVPPSAMATLRISLLSGEPIAAAHAAASAERIRDANPALDPFDKDARTAALSFEINKNVKLGLPAVKAVQMAMANMAQDKSQAEIITKNYNKELRSDPGGNTKTLQKTLNSATPGIFSKAPPVPIQMQAENEQLVSTYYSMTQNMDTARQLAEKQLRTSWGVSNMNGKPELVKYPPERLGVTSDIIRSDLADHAKAVGFTGDPAELQLVPGPYTDSSGGRAWRVEHADPKTGVRDVVLDKNNVPIGYVIPTGIDFEKTRQALLDKKIAVAKAERDAARKTDAEQINGEKELADHWLRPGTVGWH